MALKRRPSHLFGAGLSPTEEADDLEVTAAPDVDEGLVAKKRAAEGPTPRVRPSPPVITEVSRNRPQAEDEDAEAEIYLAMEFARRRSARPGLPTAPGNQGMDTMSLGDSFATNLSEVPEEEGDLGAYEGQAEIEVPALDPDIAREIAESRDSTLTDAGPSWITEDGDSVKDDMDEIAPMDWSQHPENPRRVSGRSDDGDEDDEDVEDDDATAGALGGGTNSASRGSLEASRDFKRSFEV